MHAHRLILCLGVIAGAFGVGSFQAAARAQTLETERNSWPFLVTDIAAPGARPQWTAGGPLLFGRMTDEGGSAVGFRPFWVQTADQHGQFQAGYFLYPLFSYRQYETTYQWNILDLIRRTGRRAGAPAPQSRLELTGGDFEIWPFWFSRQTGDPALSYRGLFPVAGTIKNKLGFDQATWLAFPLYARTEKRGIVTTSVPWPILRITSGAAHGFGIWPLFEHRNKPGAWDQQTYLWPLGYNNTTYPAPDAAPGTPPRREIGALPLYARHTGPGYFDENFLWPFFGYTDRTQPAAYHERRYFWPLLVQGRGDHYINRWGPIYTHSINKGYDKKWFAWPLVRHAEWQDRGLNLSKTQFFYFVYWSETQRSATHPNKPTASLTHVWPLFSNWNNGAGHTQFQLFSPLDVFFPTNEQMRLAWSPLFAIARHEQTAPGESRTSLLWNAVTWRRDDAHQEREFHLGPLLSVASHQAEERIAIGNGLIAFHRDARSHWKTLWLDFPSKAAKPAQQPR